MDEKMKNLPEGWEIKKLGDVCKIIMGQSPASETYSDDDNFIPFFQGKAEFTDLYPIPKKYCTKPTKIAEPLDVLLSVRAPVGTTNIANQRCCIGRGLSALRFENYKYGFYFLRSIQQELDSKGTGTTFRAISGEVIREALIPYPPLETQQRIVSKIEELFSELEKGVEELKKSLDQLKVYRQSVLKWAFEGRFTNENVKEGELPEGWEWKSLKELTTILGDGLHGTPKYDENGDCFFINGNNLVNGRIEIKSNTKKISYDEYLKHKKPLNDKTVFVSINGTLGNVAFYNNEKVALGKSACYFNLIDTINKYFVKYIIQSQRFINYALNSATGSTIPNVSLKSMREFQIPVPVIEEQHQIVQEIESRLSVADKMEEQIKTSLQQAEALKQSILKKAFSGELVTGRV